MKGHAKILEITSYPPPHAGWGVRVAFVRRHLEASGHHCSVLNTGKSRKIRSKDYLDVQNGIDYLRKVICHARNGYLIHTHLNGDSIKGLVLTILAEIISVLIGRKCVLTFHAGPEQRFFPTKRSHVLAPLYALAFALPERVICNSHVVKRKIKPIVSPATRLSRSQHSVVSISSIRRLHYQKSLKISLNTAILLSYLISFCALSSLSIH